MKEFEQIPWKSVVSFLEKNPYQEKRLEYVKQNTDAIPDIQESDEWQIEPVEPMGPLSCILYCQNQEYMNLSNTARLSFVRTECTSLQERAETHLRGRAWPVRRTAEGIVAAAFEPSSKWTKLGFSALAELYECQLIFFNCEKKEISFIPEDVRVWKSERDCYWIQHDGRAVWTPPKSFSKKQIGKWIEEKEEDSWKISWPSQTGTLVELKEVAEKLDIVVPPKILKDDLALKIGRSQSIQMFSNW